MSDRDNGKGNDTGKRRLSTKNSIPHERHICYRKKLSKATLNRDISICLFVAERIVISRGAQVIMPASHVTPVFMVPIFFSAAESSSVRVPNHGMVTQNTPRNIGNQNFSICGKYEVIVLTRQHMLETVSTRAVRVRVW